MKQLSFTAGGSKVDIAYAGKDIGNVSPGFGQNAAKNEATLLRKINFDGTVVRMNVHASDQIIDLSGRRAEDWLDCDALITTQPKLGLALYAADCIPLVLWSIVKPLVALAHLGRQGATLGLASKTIRYIKNEYKISPPDLHGWIGPSIKQVSYAFRPEDVAERFPGKAWQPFLQTSGGQIQADVMGYVVKELINAGIKKENIVVEPVDTGADEQYFSHYRSKKTNEPEGRNAMIVYLAKATNHDILNKL